MAQVNAKCTNCNAEIIIDNEKDADICPNCNTAFVSEKAIRLYNSQRNEKDELKSIKRRHMWKSLGKGLLMVLECIGYLFYCLFFVWLFVDITNDLKKK